MPGLQKVEIDIAIASHNQPITYPDFVDAIAQIGTMVGCSLPGGELTHLLWDQIQKRFATFTKEDFMLAFELNALGEYVGTIPGNKSKHEHYNVFSLIYMADCLVSYNKFRSPIITRINSIKIEKPCDPQAEAKAVEAMNRRIREDVAGDLKTFQFEAQKYDHLKETGVEIVPENEKPAYIEEAKERIIKRLKSMKVLLVEDVKLIIGIEATKGIAFKEIKNPEIKSQIKAEIKKLAYEKYIFSQREI